MEPITNHFGPYYCLVKKGQTFYTTVHAWWTTCMLTRRRIAVYRDLDQIEEKWEMKIDRIVPLTVCNFLDQLVTMTMNW